MSASVSALSPKYKEFVDRFLASSKASLNAQLKELDATFSETLETRLLETSYSQAEVASIFEQVRFVVKNAVQTELQAAAFGNAEIFRSVFAQVDECGLSLSLDMKAFGDTAAIAAIAQYDQDRNRPSGGKLPSLGSLASSADLVSLKEENALLKDKLQKVQTQFTQLMKEKSGTNQTIAERDDRIAALEKELLTLRLQGPKIVEKVVVEKAAEPPQGSARASPGSEAALVEELVVMRKRISDLESELSKKVTDTVQFRNMKAMMNTKNEELRTLRSRLAKYEPASNSSQDDRPAEDSDDSGRPEDSDSD